MPAQPQSSRSNQRLDQAGFDRVVALHERFARGGGGVRASLQFVEAPGVDGRRRVLNEADFTGADLHGARFTGSHLERALLYCADLSGCDLRASNLKRADLRGASLAGASLNGAVMDEADMRAAYIVRVRSDGTSQIHRHGDWSQHESAADGLGADFSNCAMRGVRLCAANLKGANFTGAVLDAADFTGAKLTDAIFRDTVLTSVDLDRLGLSPSQLAGCVLDPTAEALARVPALLLRLRDAVEWVDSGGRRGAPAALDAEDLRPLSGALSGRALTALSARGACGAHVNFANSRLQGANFDGADLRGAFFDGADLRGASFRGAKLSHARFPRADLAPLMLPDGRAHAPSFEGASMDRTDFSDTVLERCPPNQP
jgi:uncharacterized protein YjbI with pentapeptide repeats